ncbi:MAG: glycosyltransferase family 2 protein [Anaerolineales bacterium]
MEVSIIVPVFNEAQSLPVLHQKIHDAMDQVTVEWEVIYVDDGSQDDSLNALEALASGDKPHTRVLSFRRNFGQTTAISAGIDHSTGAVIVLIDADLQNDPADIPKLLTKIDEGYDLVSGWRVSRQDAYVTRTFPSKVANGLISKVTGVKLHDYGCTLKAYRREVLTGFRLYGEMHRFIPAYASSVGAKIVEVPVQHHPRKYGKAKYGLERTLKVTLDLFTVKYLISYSQKPIYIFGTVGVGLIMLSILDVIYLVIRRFTIGEHMIRSPLLQMGTMLFVMGFNSILLGLIAEQVMRTYHEAQSKPTYTLRRKINLQD